MKNLEQIYDNGKKFFGKATRVHISEKSGLMTVYCYNHILCYEDEDGQLHGILTNEMIEKMKLVVNGKYMKYNEKYMMYYDRVKRHRDEFIKQYYSDKEECRNRYNNH